MNVKTPLNPTEQAVRAAALKLLDLIRELGRESRFAPLRGALESILQDADSELQETRKVYGMLAEVIADRLHIPATDCLAVVHELVGERDPRLLTDHAGRPMTPPRPDLLQQAKQLLLSVRVEYRRTSASQTERRFEVYLRHGDSDSAARHRATELLSWDDLPPDVRDEFLLGFDPARPEPVRFTLYPRKEG